MGRNMSICSDGDLCLPNPDTWWSAWYLSLTLYWLRISLHVAHDRDEIHERNLFAGGQDYSKESWVDSTWWSTAPMCLVVADSSISDYSNPARLLFG